MGNTISLYGTKEQVESLSAKIKEVAEKNNVNKCQAVEMLIAAGTGDNVPVDNGFEEKYNIEHANNQTLTAQVESLQNEIKQLQEQLKSGHEQNVGGGNSAFMIPPRLGAVVLELISNNGDLYKNINNVEQACDYLLTPYWRKGVFVADEHDIENYLAIINGGN